METAAGLPRAARSRLELHRRSLSTAGDVLRSAVHSDGGVTGVVDATAVSREFRSRGFVAVRQLLPEGHVDALRSALQAYMATSDENSDPRSGGQMRYYEGTPDERGPHTLKYIGFKEFNHLPEDNPALRSLRELPLHQDLEDLARACLSTPVDHPSRTLTYATRWLDKPPVRDRSKRSATPAHQDSFYFVGRQEDCAHAQQLAKTELPRLCSFWIALDHVDEENGCLRYRPYSHMRGLLPHRPGGPLGFSQQLSVDSDEMRLSEFHPGPRENNRQRHRADPAEVSLSLAPGHLALCTALYRKGLTM